MFSRQTFACRFVVALLLLASMATVTPVAAQTGDLVQAGIAAAVRGNVRRIEVSAAPAEPRNNVVGREVRSGDQIFLGDTIETGSGAGLQIMLLDETIFTIGPDAAMVIDTFVYDPETDTGQLAASVVKGAFRFVSGRISKRNPADMNLRVGVATMGIRGTAAAGVVTPPDQNGNPEKVDVVLLGPGTNNNANERAGRITLGNSGNSVEISRPGFGSSVVGQQGSPTPAVRLSLQQINAITAGLKAKPGSENDDGQNDSDGSDNGGDGNSNGDGNTDGGNSDSGNSEGNDDGDQASGNSDSEGSTSNDSGGDGQAAGGQSVEGGNVAELSGQDIGIGAETASVVEQVTTTVIDTVEEQTQDAAQSAGDTLAAIATFDELRAIESGIASFAMTDVPLTYDNGPTAASGGHFDAAFLIDFSARTLNVAVGNVAYQFGERTERSFAYAEGTNFQNLNGATTTVRTSDDDPAGNFKQGFLGQIGNNRNDGCNGCESSEYVRDMINTDNIRIEHEILNDVAKGIPIDSARIAVSITSSADGTVISGGATAPRN